MIEDTISTRKAFGTELVEQGSIREDFVVMDADIAKSCTTDLFHKAFPERSYNFGIAEQDMFASAAGFASTGKSVICATYGVFASMRACEQIRTFVCYPNLNVKILASHAGYQAGSDGATHQAIEDIAIMRALPNMTIVQPCDSISAKKAVKAVLDYYGPVYIRVLKYAIPLIFNEEDSFVIGKAREAVNYGNDIAIIATGAMVFKAIEAAEQLNSEGIKAKVIDMHTIKPIDSEVIIKAARETGGIITVEDHNVIGGLGGAVAEILSENFPTLIKRIGIPDEFGESGEPDELYSYHHMNVVDIVKAAKEKAV